MNLTNNGSRFPRSVANQLIQESTQNVRGRLVNASNQGKRCGAVTKCLLAPVTFPGSFLKSCFLSCLRKEREIRALSEEERESSSSCTTKTAARVNQLIDFIDESLRKVPRPPKPEISGEMIRKFADHSKNLTESINPKAAVASMVPAGAYLSYAIFSAWSGEREFTGIAFQSLAISALTIGSQTLVTYLQSPKKSIAEEIDDSLFYFFEDLTDEKLDRHMNESLELMRSKLKEHGFKESDLGEFAKEYLKTSIIRVIKKTLETTKADRINLCNKALNYLASKGVEKAIEKLPPTKKLIEGAVSSVAVKMLLIDLAADAVFKSTLGFSPNLIKAVATDLVSFPILSLSNGLFARCSTKIGSLALSTALSEAVIIVPQAYRVSQEINRFAEEGREALEARGEQAFPNRIKSFLETSMSDYPNATIAVSHTIFPAVFAMFLDIYGEVSSSSNIVSVIINSLKERGSSTQANRSVSSSSTSSSSRSAIEMEEVREAALLLINNFHGAFVGHFMGELHQVIEENIDDAKVVADSFNLVGRRGNEGTAEATTALVCNMFRRMGATISDKAEDRFSRGFAKVVAAPRELAFSAVTVPVNYLYGKHGSGTAAVPQAVVDGAEKVHGYFRINKLLDSFALRKVTSELELKDESGEQLPRLEEKES